MTKEEMRANLERFISKQMEQLGVDDNKIEVLLSEEESMKYRRVYDRIRGYRSALVDMGFSRIEIDDIIIELGW